MLKRLLHHQHIVTSIFTHKFPSISTAQRMTLAKVRLDQKSWEILQALHDVLEPLELATRALSGKHCVTQDLVHTTIGILRYGLEPKSQDGPYLTILKTSVLAQFELYFDLMMSQKQ